MARKHGKNRHYGRPQFEELEPRILYSADLAPQTEPAAEIRVEPASAEETAEATQPPYAVVTQEDVENHAITAASEALIVNEADLSATDTIASERRLELVFINDDVVDPESFINDLVDSETTDYETITLNSDQDGFEQILNAVNQYENIDAIHFVTHGDNASIKLGNLWINPDNLNEFEDEFRVLGLSLADDADLLFYGCDIAESDTGQSLIDTLSDWTEADISASTNLTGSSQHNADWELEYIIGPVETQIAFSNTLQSDWNGVLNTYTVTNTNDSGAGSLRQAISNANANGGADNITFSLGAGISTITLSSQLPDISDIVHIDGSQSGTPSIVLNGGNSITYGINLSGGASGSTIRGLIIQGFTSSGINIGSSNNIIAGNYVGTNSNATAAASNGNGVNIWTGTNNTIGGNTAADRNIISGNGNNGIVISGSTSSTVVRGNYIGTDLSGTSAIGNTNQGIWSDSTGNIYGGTGAGEGNLISGNGNGVTLAGDSNTVQGNLIGTDITGTLDLGNNWTGVYILGGDNNQIGGSSAAARNVISGNGILGINIDSGTGNLVQGNYIGTDITGTSGVGNTGTGVLFENSSTDNTIGGANAGEGNVVSGNDSYGIALNWSDSNTIQGNIVGLAADGTSHIGNNDQGVRLSFSNSNTVGGNAANARNIISDNNGIGLYIEGNNNTVQGNYIGTDSTGLLNRFNNSIGLHLSSGTGNIIGGSGAGEGNVISWNASDGIQMGSGADSNTIQGNYIGVGADGTTATGNNTRGIALFSGAEDNLIGGTGANEGNIIANNASMGIVVSGAASINNAILSNAIHSNGDIGIGHDFDGVTANDTQDPDTGGNNLQNYPKLDAAVIDGSNVQIIGLLNSTANTDYRIEFFASTSADPSGHGEAERYLGAISVTTDSAGNANIYADLVATVVNGEIITATATVDLGGGNYGDTSEFAANVVASDDHTPSDITATKTLQGGLQINNDGGDDTYLVADNGIGSSNLSSVTYEMQFNSTSTSRIVFLSYYNGGDELRLITKSDGDLNIAINNISIFSSAMNYDALSDGQDHSLSFTWDNSAGDWEVFIDGSLMDSGTGLATGATIDAGGSLVFGLEQDNSELDFDNQYQRFSGTLYDARLFDTVRTDQEIAANYRATLPRDETNLIANWQFDAVSTGGVVTDTVEGNNLTVAHFTDAAFTANTPSLTFELDENSLTGTLVGSVIGTDAEREALIASLLASDSDLIYSTETGKFYKPVWGSIDWSSASTAAQATSLNSVNGQLATIRSATEQEIAATVSASGGLWIGATDETVEGEHRWIEDGAEADQFWSGDETGHPVDGAYSNWLSGRPDNTGGNQHYTLIRTDGYWNEEDSAHTENGYLVEWDAEEILNATETLTYSIHSQTVPGAFTINTGTGQISVSDGSLLDYETHASHTLTIRVTDVDSNTYDKNFDVQLNDLTEPTSTPTDLSSGIELNTDGGNDAYLKADNGSALLAGLTSFTLETSFALEDIDNEPGLFSYYVSSDEIRLRFDAADHLRLKINNVNVTTSNTYSELLDGNMHHVAVSWDNTNGDVMFYIDGEFVEHITGLEAGHTIAAGGELALGNDQDGLDTGYKTGQTLSGTLHDTRIWDEVRSAEEISLNYQHKFDTSSLPSGLIANWQMDGFNGSNEVVDVVSGNNLSMSHAAGVGFIASTPVVDLQIDENVSDGTSVGFVQPSDPELPQDIVSDGLFLEGDNGLWQIYNTGETIGDWTVVEGRVDHTSTFESPLGGVGVELERGVGDPAGAISQTLATEIGTQYQVTFSATGNFGDSSDTTKFFRASAGGVSNDYTVSGSFGAEIYEPFSFTFTADSTSTDLIFKALAETGYGAVISDVRVTQISQAVSNILNSDSTLSYDAGTGKFYRPVTTAQSWTDAQNSAVSERVNGISGQLVTIHSASENSVVHSLTNQAPERDYWIGATDLVTENEFRWYQGTTAGDHFSTGNIAEAGYYTNYNGGEPSNSGAGEHHLEFQPSDGQWNDIDEANGNYYVIEWDASEVLSNYTFTLTDDAGGRFAIDSNSGEITVADTSLIDYETANSHNVTVEVTDAAGNTYDEVMAIAVNNQGGETAQTLPAAQSVDEDSNLTFSSGGGNAVTVSDTSGNDELLQVTLTVTNGTLTLARTTGLSIPGGSDGSASMVLQGTESDLNAAMDGMVYTPTGGYNGSANLSVTTAQAASLEGYYSFEAGNAVDDSVGVSQNGTLIGDANVITDGTRGEVLNLDGSGDSVQITGFLGNPGDISLAAWVNLTSADANGADVISLGDNMVLRLDYDDVGAEDAGVTGFYYNGATWVALKTGEFLAGTGWHHVAYVFNDANDTHTVYINGTAILSAATSDSIVYGNGSDTFIGAHGNSETTYDFNGQIDDARIYTRALSGDEIAALATDQISVTGNVAITVSSVNDAPYFTALPSAEPTTVESLTDASSVTSADLDNDGDIDLISTTSGGELRWHENDGSGNFAAGTLIASAQNFRAVATYDLEGDGDMDIVAMNDDPADTANSVFVLTNNFIGSGSVSFSTQSFEGSIGGESDGGQDLAIGDIDGDGRADIAGIFYRSIGDSQLVVFEQNAVGVWTKTYTDAISNGHGVEIVDLDGDTDLDIVTGDFQTREITFYENDGNATAGFTAQLVYDDVVEQMFDMTVGDFDADGDQDIAYITWGVTDKVVLLENDGNANPSFTYSVIATETGGLLYHIDTADIDGDGTLDLIVVNETGDSILIYENDGSAAFTKDVIDANSRGPVWVEAADVDGDGENDLIFAARDDNFVGMHVNQGSGSYIRGSVNEDIALGSLQVQVADDDIGAGELEISITVTNGRIIIPTGSVTVTAGASSTPTITFTGTVADVNTAMNSFTFAPDTDFYGLGEVQIVVDDQGNTGGPAETATKTFYVDVLPVNDVPSVTNLDGDSLAYTEGDSAVVIDQTSDSVIADVDSVDFDTGTLVVTISAGGTPAEDVLSIQNVGTGAGQISVSGANVSYEGTTIGTFSGGSSGTPLTVTFNANATPTAASALAQNITYENTHLGDPSTATRTITFTVNDGDGGTSTGQSTSVVVSGTNDSPVNTVPASINVTEDVATALTGISIADVDAGASSMLVTLSVPVGSLAATSDAFVTVGGTASDLTLTGTVTNINTFIAASNITYTTASNANGSVTLTVLTSDQGNTGSGGIQTDSDVVTLNITAVNDSPTVASNTGVTVVEASTSNIITTVMLNEGDVDDSGTGLTYTITTDVVNGTLNLSGVAIGLNDTFTQADIDSSLVTYDHNGSQTSSDSFNFSLTDGNEDGATDASGTFNFTVTNVNDAPVLDNSGSMTLTTITEDDISNSGNTMASIIASAGGDRMTDDDPAASEGIAITSRNNGNGFWQYSTDGGTNWSNVGTVSETQALLLRDTDRVRFLPDAENGTSKTFEFRAWDQTSGSAGTKVDVTTNGGTSAFSTATESAAITVSSVNDAPTLSNGASHALTGTDENTTSSATLISALLTGVSHGDVDNSASSGVAITSVTGNGTWEYSTDGAVWTAFGSVSVTNALLLTSTSQVRYVPDGIAAESPQFDFQAWDQTSDSASINGSPAYANPGAGGTTAYSSESASATLAVSEVNDVPLFLGTSLVNNGTFDTDVTGWTSYATAHTPSVSSGKLQLQRLSEVDQVVSGLTIGQTYYLSFELADTSSTVQRDANVTLTGASTLIDVDLQTGINEPATTYTYVFVADATSATLLLSDETNSGLGTLTTFDNVVIAQATTSETATTYTENDSPLTVAPLITSGDIDDTQLSSASVAITSGFETNVDVLGYTLTGSIAGSYDGATGILSLSGAGTLAEYNSVLRSVTFNNASDDPSTATRTVTFTVNDGSNNAAFTRDISFTAVNDTPVVSSPGSAYSATENVSLSIEGTGFSVADVDAQSGTQTATLVVGEGALTVAVGDSGVSISSGNGSGSVVLTGTLTQIDNLLTGSSTGTITYLNSSDTPAASTTITVTVNDGGNTGNDPGLTGGASDEEDFATQTINISTTNDDPANAGALPTDVAVLEDVYSNIDLSALDLIDPDASTNPLTVTLSTSASGELSAAAGPGITVGGTPTALTLTGSQSDLNTYLNDTTKLSYLHPTTHLNGNDADTITVVLNDNGNTGVGGGGDVSLGTVNVDVTAVNDHPVISSLNGESVSATNDGTVFALTGSTVPTLTDPDSPANLDGGSLVVAGLSFDASDLLRMDTSGSVSLSTGFANGSNVSVGGVTVGFLSSVGDSGATISFNSNATLSRVQTLLQSFTYESTSASLGLRTVNFTLVDGDGIANGGNDTATATVNVVLRDASNGAVTTDEDLTHTFVATDFDFTGVTGANLLNITITSPPPTGTLNLAGVGTVSAGQVVTKAQIDNGDLTFIPAADANGLPHTSFDFAVNGGNLTVSVLAGEPDLWTLNGGGLEETDDILASSSHFGPSGTVGSGISVVATSTTVDAAYLSQGDVYFDGYISDASYSAGELSALDAWVLAGGILISGADSASHNAIATDHGLTTSSSSAGSWNVADPGHAIMDGPFGTVGNISTHGLNTYFNTGSLQVGDQVLATDGISGEPTMILRAHGSGYLLFTGDIGIFTEDMTGGGTISTSNDILAANIFAWAVSQLTPSETYSMEVDVNAVNDEPSLTTAGNQSVAYESGAHTVASFTTPSAGGAADESGQTFSYTVSNDNNALFSVQPSIDASGQLTYTVANSQSGTATVTVSVTDSGGTANAGDDTSPDQTFDIIIAGNTAPTISAIANQTMDEDGNTGALAFTVADAEAAAGVLTVSASSSDQALISDANLTLVDLGSGNWTITATSLADINGSATITVTVDDGTNTTDETFVVTVDAVNDEPGFTTVGNQSVAYDSGAHTVAGFASPSAGGAADESGQTFSYTVSNDNNALFSVQPSIDASGQLTYTVANSQSGTATVTVSVTDSGGTANAGDDTSPDQTFDVTIAVNTPPTITPIADQTMDEDNNTGALNFAVADAETTVGSLTVTAVSSNQALIPDANLTLIDLGGGNWTVNATPLADMNGSATVTVTVDDGITTTDETFLITVNPVNDAPTDIAPLGIAAAEHTDSTGGLALGSLTTSDVDSGDSHSYSISGGADSAHFTLGGAGSDELIMDDGILDFENQSSYSVEITATDAFGASVFRTITLSITDVNEAPSLSLSNLLANLAEDTDTTSSIKVADIAISDDALGTNTLTLTGTDSALFEIVGNELRLRAGTTLDHEALAAFDVGVRVDDAGVGGSPDDGVDITLTITDVNEFDPVIADQTLNIAENSANGSSVGTVIASDPDTSQFLTFNIIGGNTGAAFSIDPLTGEILVNDHTQLDFETSPVFNLTVEVNDNWAPMRYAQASITIAIDNLNDLAPAIDDPSILLAEDAFAGTSVFDFADRYTAGDTDRDGDILSYSLVSGNDQGHFSIDASTGVVTLDSGTLDFESVSTYTLTVQASDGSFTDSAALTITIDNINEAPIISAPTTISTDEDIALDFTGNLTVSDPDAGNTDIEVTLSSSHGVLLPGDQSGLSSLPINNALDHFVLRGSATSINAALNGLQFIPDTDFNGEATLSIEMDDLGETGLGAALQDIATIQITVNPVNDEPALELPNNTEIQPGEPLRFSTALENLQPLQDIDSQDSMLELTLNIDHGQLSIEDSSLLANITHSDGASFSATGDVDTLNKIFNALVITPDLGYFGELNLDLTINDLGGSGIGGLRSISSQITLYVPVPALPDNPDKEEVSDEENASETPSLIMEAVIDHRMMRDTVVGADTDIVISLPNKLSFNLESWVENDTLVAVKLKDAATAPVELMSGKPLQTQTKASLLELLNTYSLKDPSSMPSFKSISGSLSDGWANEDDAHDVEWNILMAEFGGASLVVGSLVWLLKGSSLASSLLVSYPAWRGLDPLPVLLPRETNRSSKSATAHARPEQQERPKNQRFRLQEQTTPLH